MVEWSGQIKPYKLGEMVLSEEKNAAGDLTQKIEIKLDDAGECSKRKLASSCLPVGLHTENPALFCNMTLSGCTETTLNKMVLVK